MAGTHTITQALAAAMAYSPEPMVLSDHRAPDQPLCAVNDAFLTLTGYRREEVVGRNCRFLQGPGTDVRAVARLRRCIGEGRAVVEWIVNHRRDGSPFWNLLFLSPVRDADGTLLHFFGNQQNITTGCPPWLDGFVVGEAHRAAAAEAAFQGVIDEMIGLGVPADGGALQGEALARAVALARRLSEATVQLTPGPAA